MICFIAVLICFVFSIFGILAYEIYYRIKTNMFPFCRKGDKHEK